MRHVLILIATSLLLGRAEAADPPPAAERARVLAAELAAVGGFRALPASGAAEAAVLAREEAQADARRLVFFVPRASLDAEREAWSALARDRRAAGVSLQVYGVGDDGAATSITWAGERSPLLAPAQAASPLEADLGTGVAWAPSAAAAFERAAREGRLVLLVQLSGRFDAVPET